MDDLLNKLIYPVQTLYSKKPSLHESIKAQLYTLGFENNYLSIPEIYVNHTRKRIDMGWIDKANNIKALFEIDYGSPGFNSMNKLKQVNGERKYIIIIKPSKRSSFRKKIIEAYQNNIKVYCVMWKRFLVPIYKTS